MRVLRIIFSSFGGLLVRAFLGSVAERGDERRRGGEKKERDELVVGEKQSSCTQWQRKGGDPTSCPIAASLAT
jgi:hypothetical protein